MRQAFLVSMLVLLGLGIVKAPHGQLTVPGAVANSERAAILSFGGADPSSATNNLKRSNQQTDNLAQEDLSKVSGVWARLFGAKQIDALMELYAPEAVFLTGQGDRITGKDAIRELFKTALEKMSSNLTVRSIVSESSGDLAYDSGDYRETITPVSGGAKLEPKGNYVIVFKRQPNGKWLIKQHVWTDVPPVSK